MSLFRGARSKKIMQKGLTMVEIMVTLLLTTIIMGILYVVLSSTFKISGQVQTQLAIDEEVVKLNSGLQSIISRNWTGLSVTSDASKTLSLQSRFAIIPDFVDATITYEDGKVLFVYYISETETTTTTISQNLEDFYFDPRGQFIYYFGTFVIDNHSREVKGAVRFY